MTVDSIKKTSAFATAILSLIVTGCGQELSPHEAQDRAIVYLANKYPESILDLSKTKIKKIGNDWVVSYAVPPAYQGGAPSIWVNAKSGKIDKSENYQ